MGATVHNLTADEAHELGDRLRKSKREVAPEGRGTIVTNPTKGLVDRMKKALRLK